MELEKGATIQFDYINWKREKSERKAFVYRVVWSWNEYHPEEQWFLVALDEDKAEVRFFAMKDISNVKRLR